MQRRLVRDDTNQQVVDELRHQQGIEANRLAKVHPQLTKHNSNLCLHYQEKERVASLTEVVQKLEEEISRLKSTQYLENQKVRLMLNSLSEEVARESKTREEAIEKAGRLQEELEEERRTKRATVQELESQAERAKRERLIAVEERQRLVLLEEQLDVEKRQREEVRSS